MKLITWNVQWCRGCDGRVDAARIVAHARALADFDVLCLQEVAAGWRDLPGSRGENQFEQFARLLPGHEAIPVAAVDLPAPGGGRRAFGNLILSRYPVAQALRIQLPWPSDPPQPSMPRVLLEATVESPLGPIRVMTTHLEYYSALQRHAQVDAIRARHAEACGHALVDRARSAASGPFRPAPQTMSAILTGDFNLRPDDPLHARLQAPLGEGSTALLDAWQVLHPHAPHAPTSRVHERDPRKPPYACDFVFVSEDLVPRLRAITVDAATQASDHQPVMVELD